MWCSHKNLLSIKKTCKQSKKTKFFIYIYKEASEVNRKDKREIDLHISISSLSVNCDMSVVFSVSFGFLRQ